MLKYIKYSLVLISVYLMSGGAIASENSWEEEIDECESYISIYGSSNVNRFRFFNVNPQIALASGKFHNEAVHQEITIPVYDFTGPNNRMLNDFLKMINASEHRKSHRGTDFGHLCVRSQMDNVVHSDKSKIFHQADFCSKFVVVGGNGSPFKRIEEFCCMKAENLTIAEIANHSSFL